MPDQEKQGRDFGMSASMVDLDEGGFVDQARKWMLECEFPGTDFFVRLDGQRPYLQIEVSGKCAETGAQMEWRGRKWFLSLHMTKSEVVQTAFLAVMTAAEHEVREHFKFRGQSIFSPHYDVDQLALLRQRQDSQDVR